MWTAILGIIASLVTILVIWVQREEKREKLKVWKDFEQLELEFRRAVADKDPVKIAQISMQMNNLREKYVFLKEPK